MRCRSSSFRCWAAILPLPIMNIAPRTAATRTPEHAPMRTGRLSFLIVRWPVSRGSRLTARIGLVLDPESDCDGQRADLLGLADLLRNLHPRQRVADANVHADQALELAGEPRQVGGAAREHDLADAKRAGLVLVILERGDELARKRLDSPAHRLSCRLRLIGGDPVRDHLVHQG